MSWYLFALLDAPPRGRPGRGLGLGLAAIAVRRIGGCFVAMERRADVPPIEFDVLKRHERTVARLASAVPAILPVRFGTLMELDEIESVLADRQQEIAEGFDLVRDRQQMTWRVQRARRAREPGAARTVRPGPSTTSGTAYLRSRATAAHPVAPASFRSVRRAVRALIVAERFQPRGGSLPDSLYHLVPKRSVAKYAAVAGRLSRSSPALSVSGPWPPYAFAPEVM